MRRSVMQPTSMACKRRCVSYRANGLMSVVIDACTVLPASRSVNPSSWSPSPRTWAPARRTVLWAKLGLCRTEFSVDNL